MVRTGTLSGRLLLRNTGYNLAGVGVLVILAVVAIPILIEGLGVHRFGILTLTWATVGYFSLFNLGLGRALTQGIAGKLAMGLEDEVPPLIWTGLLMVFALGLLAALLLFLSAQPLVDRALNIPDELRHEALRAFRVLALGLPFVVSAAALVGILEARQRFGAINAVTVPMAGLTYLGPIFVLQFSSSLIPVVAFLVAVRMAGWLLYLALAFRTFPAIMGQIRPDRATVRPLLRFGGWTTVSNVVSPMMVYFDRFVIGGLLSMAGVAYYVSAQSIVLKLGAVSGAAVAVLFPAFAASSAQESSGVAALFDRGLRMMFLLVFPLSLVLATFAGEALNLWLGSDFAANGTRILQWLAAGLLINGVAKVPSTVIQGIGRPDLNAFVQIIELPFYIALAWVLIARYGIEGAALAWVVRALVDAVALLWITTRLVSETRSTTLRHGIAGGIGVLMIAAATLPEAWEAKLTFLAVSLGVFCLAGWQHLLTAGERGSLRSASPWRG